MKVYHDIITAFFVNPGMKAASSIYHSTELPNRGPHQSFHGNLVITLLSHITITLLDKHTINYIGCCHP